MLIYLDIQLAIFRSYLDTVWILLVTATPGATSRNNRTFLVRIYQYFVNHNYHCIISICYTNMFLNFAVLFPYLCFLSCFVSQKVDYVTFTFLLHSYSWLTWTCENLNSGIRNAVDSKYLKIRIKNKLSNYTIKPKEQKEMIQITGIPIDLWRF